MRTLPSINRLLATLVLACLLPGMVLYLAALGWSYRSQRAELVANTVATARALMAGVDERLLSASVGLADLARSRALAEGNLVEFQDEASALAKALPLRNIVLVDAQGRQLVNTRAGATGEDTAALHPRAAELIEADQPRVLDLFRTPAENRWVVGVGISARLEGRAGYALVANIDPKALQDGLLRQKLPPEWIAAVVDTRGVIAGRTHDHERFVGTAARAALVARIQEVPEDAVESVTVDGIPVITAFSRSPSNGWSIVIGIPKAELVAPLERMLWLFGAGSAVVLAITLWMSRRLAARISESLRTLAAEARSVGHRSAIALPPAAFAEADQLGQSLLHADAAMHDAEARRSRAEALLDAVMAATGEAILCVDEDERIVAFNRRAMRMFQVGADDARGQPLRRLLPRASGQSLAAFATQVEADPAVRALRWNGEPLAAEASIRATPQAEGTIYTIALRPATVDA